jgi:hypothetical protein
VLACVPLLCSICCTIGGVVLGQGDVLGVGGCVCPLGVHAAYLPFCARDVGYPCIVFVVLSLLLYCFVFGFSSAGLWVGVE